jgi:hypothetical protein
MPKRLCVLIAAAYPVLGWAFPNSNNALDRPFTLLNPEPFTLEAEYHRILESDGARSFIFPRPCLSPMDSSQVCPVPSGWKFSDTAHDRGIYLSPIAEYEYRRLPQSSHALDFGLVTVGNTGKLSFYLDARMYTEQQEDFYAPSYDREFIERQDEAATGSVAYQSYSRYRSNLSYDMDWGRLSVARDAAHWGPGRFANLVFQEDAIPFNQLTFTSRLGPISVQSMYGQLSAGLDWESDTTSQPKSMYAHRYELLASKNLLLGISEQLILFKVSAPFAFVPVIPLFITKATEKERLNNGNIAFDAAYRLPGIGELYSELLIDDIQSPTSLFNDQWSNKWAWMAGMHGIRDLGTARSGMILEYSRVEPWVYTHYIKNTSQTANQDYPLGNPWGPNSQAVIAKAYVDWRDTWYVSTQLTLIWKGKDLGSAIEDIHPEEQAKKEFLAGLDGPDAKVICFLQYRRSRVFAHARLEFSEEVRGVSGLGFYY